ncbi:threonine ammonia-lyase [Sulfurimonas sp. HSL3-2]|uniref:threonine ammonia-lyase n=1 Tax=Hydrocurvibacter mobilis TaxID=3131936 RepID=UPI0031F8241C
MLDINKIYEARERIKDVVVHTPFSFAPYLSEASGCEVYLKKENLQVTGAFKIRGAYNKIASLSEEQRQSGVVAASAGNHAQGVAFSAQKFGIKATIVMPDSTPLTKINGVKHYGAQVILAGTNYDEAYAYALQYGEENSLVFVHPFEDDEVMAGQGTLALEILEEAKELDAVLIPVGGGGLISGMAKAFKALNPHIQVIGVSAKGAPALKNSYEMGRPIDSVSVRTIADGIAVRDCSPITLAYIIESVDKFITVDDEEIASAILYLLERQKLVVEGAGAVGVAALLHNELPELKDKKVAVVLSGGNMDVTLLSVIIEKGLIKSSRKMKLTVTLVDKPGSLMRLTEILKDLNANIVHISYDRTSISLDYGDANVTIHLETKGEEHQEQIISVLQKEGYLSRYIN